MVLWRQLCTEDEFNNDGSLRWMTQLFHCYPVHNQLTHDTQRHHDCGGGGVVWFISQKLTLFKHRPLKHSAEKRFLMKEKWVIGGILEEAPRFLGPQSCTGAPDCDLRVGCIIPCVVHLYNNDWKRRIEKNSSSRLYFYTKWWICNRIFIFITKTYPFTFWMTSVQCVLRPLMECSFVT